ncbi:hypothetical protein PtB15_3B72 [Puccinia triticina]|nr:hypothetical protein PtB15_3B72 [Puccinia triticina]
MFGSSLIPAWRMFPNPMTPTTPNINTTVLTASIVVIFFPNSHLANRMLKINEAYPRGTNYSGQNATHDLGEAVEKQFEQPDWSEARFLEVTAVDLKDKKFKTKPHNTR